VVAAYSEQGLRWGSACGGSIQFDARHWLAGRREHGPRDAGWWGRQRRWPLGVEWEVVQGMDMVELGEGVVCSCGQL
jgi:hypothetical protein